MIQEIRAKQLVAARFIEDKVRAIREEVGEGTAINALSGGVDSSTVTLLGHKALGKRLRTVFVENGLPGRRSGCARCSPAWAWRSRSWRPASASLRP
jgi:NH3-dependent NAD+ synthetase